MRLVLRVARGLRPPAAPDGAAIGTAFADALGTLLDPGDPAIWVVRALTVRAEAGGDAAAPDLARAIALRLREAIARALRGELADGAIRYPDRAAWLAALLWDHVRGEARGRWQYWRFAALDALPLAYVPRHLFAAEPALALPVLLRLAAAGRLRPFASAIGDSGARALLPAILARGQRAGAASQGAALARRLLANAGPALPVASSRALLVAAVEGAAASGIPPPGRAAAAAAQARALAAAARPARRSARWTAADPAPLPVRARSTGIAGVPPAGAGPGSASDASPPSRGPRLGSGDVIDTPDAGLFLLWRSVVELGLEALWPAGADPGHARLTLAATLAGPERDAAWDDPALHWLTGFVPDPNQGPLAPDAAFATRFAAHMAARAAPHPLRPVVRRCGRLRLVQDRDSEDWLALGGARDLAAFARTAEPAPPELRDPARDLGFFTAGARARRPWALLARAAYGDLARRMTGLERSSAWWLWANLLRGWGRLHPARPALLVLPRVPLDLVLRMTGLDGTRVALADGRTFEIALPGRD
jgi:hypothetical protein